MAIEVFRLVKANWLLLILVFCITLFSIQRNMGFILVSIAIPALTYQVVQYVRHRKPQSNKREIRLCAIGIVLTSILVIFATNIYRYCSSRLIEEEVATALEKFYANKREYPNNLGDLGFDAAKYQKDYGLYYVNSNGRADLTHDAIADLSPGCYWWYDFSDHQWRYNCP